MEGEGETDVLDITSSLVRVINEEVGEEELGYLPDVMEVMSSYTPESNIL